MARNIEIKARASNFAYQYSCAEELSDTPLTVLEQTDTFFKVPDGRLKLREFEDQHAQLIFYQRRNDKRPKLSTYEISTIASSHKDTKSLKNILTTAYGQLGVVTKTRHLFFSGCTRIHMDTVANLGNFIELEVVLTDDDDLADARRKAEYLMGALNIESDDLLTHAYIDLLTRRS